MHTVEDLRPQDAAAVRATVAVVARAAPSDLDRPTPCAGWDLRALLTHMTEQHYVFATAAAGRPRQPTAPDPDPLAGYRAAAARVIEDFAADDRLDRPVVAPDLGGQSFPLRLVVGFHLVDHVVHGWDVARTLGVGWELPDDVLAPAQAIARAVPDDDSRTTPGAAFAPAVPAPAGASVMDQILTLLGRSPTWRPESVAGR